MRAVIATAQHGRWGPPPPPNLSPLRREAASRKIRPASCGPERSQRPLFGCFRPSRTDGEEQALRRCAIGGNSLFELPDRSAALCRPRIIQHVAERLLLAPLDESLAPL